MEETFKKAREFAKSVLSKKLDKIDEKHYPMFLIARFMLLKESIIKKDNNNNIHFDYIKDNKYLEIIEEIAKYIPTENIVAFEDSKTFEEEISKVKFGQPFDDEKELEEDILKNNGNMIQSIKDDIKVKKRAVWIVNAIRNSFGHGKYKIQYDKEFILIDNPGYIKPTLLPISLLEKFTFIMEQENEVEHIDYIDSLRSNYKYNKYANNLSYYDLREINKSIKYKYKFGDNLYYNEYGDNNKYSKKPSNKDSKLEMIIDYKKRIKEYALIILRSPKIPNNIKLEIIGYLKDYGINDKEINAIDKDIINTEEYLKKLITIFADISNIVESINDPYEIVRFSAIYNYMQLAFAFKYENLKEKHDAKDTTAIKKLGHLKMRKLTFEYHNGNKNILDNNVKNVVGNFLKLVDLIKVYKNNFHTFSMEERNKRYLDIINYRQKFYSDIECALADRNLTIITSIRNAVEHGNIKNKDDGIVELFDKNNQNDSTTNFNCTVDDIKDLYELTEEIETDDIKEPEDSELLAELDKIISSDNKQKLIALFNEIDEITMINNLYPGVTKVSYNNLLLQSNKDNQKKLIDVLKQVKDKSR